MGVATKERRFGLSITVVRSWTEVLASHLCFQGILKSPLETELSLLTCDRSGIAITEGIAGVSLGTGAHRHVIVDRAQRSDGARAQTGISAFLVAAGEIHRALGIHAAFGAAVWRRTPIGRQTGA